MKTAVTFAFALVIVAAFTKGLFTPNARPALSFAIKFLGFVSACIVIAGYMVALCLV
jgi:hypothetical protein